MRPLSGLRDARVPAALEPSYRAAALPGGGEYSAAVWEPESLGTLAGALATRGAAALAQVSTNELLDAWSETIDELHDRESAERKRLDPTLARLCRLSEPGLDAALDAVLGGVRRRHAAELFARAEPGGERGLVAVFLSSNLPALAVQPLLPALALRRPVLLKSPSAEPLFAPALVAGLAGRLPALGEAVAAVTWRGGEPALEHEVLGAAQRVLAYGEQATLDDLERRAGAKLFGYGPRISIAAIAGDADLEVAGLARDVALMDQRGCLSIHAVYCDGDPGKLAAGLADELASLATRWPPGPATPEEQGGVGQLLADADLRNLERPDLPLAAGCVVIDPRPELRPSPGLRSVRVHPLDGLEHLPELLAPWRDRLQGAALAGAAAWALRPALEALGVTRCTEPGRLQAADAQWHNGGVSPLEVLAD